MTRTDVQKLYSFAGGRWWDPFRAVWELCTSRAAKRGLESLFRRYVTPESRILDVGCGTGVNLDRLLRLDLPFRQYTGMDFSPSMLALAQNRFGHLPRVTFCTGDATALEDTDQRYDVIVATWLLDHVHESAACVNRIQRLLATDGHLLLLFYSRARGFIASWLSPVGRVLVRADPVPKEEISKFSSVVFKRSYCGGVATLVDIAASSQVMANPGGGGG